MRKNVPRHKGAILLALLAPIAFLTIAESVARIVGAGFPTGYLERVAAGAKGRWASNPFFGYRFFPARIARNPAPLLLPAQHDPGTIRIAVLGESAAMGDPAIEFSLARALDKHLNPLGAPRRYEVLNAAMTAINSHVIVEIADALARRETDVFVLYMGNNEVVGPYGPGTAFAGVSGFGILPRWRILATRLRLASWLRNALMTRHAHQTAWGGLAMFDRQRIPTDDQRLERVYRQFAANIERILAIARRRAIRVVLCTVAVNLTDCAPFGSAQGVEPSSAAWREWAENQQTGRRALQEGRRADAVEALSRAAALDPGHAETIFHLALAERALGREAEAQNRFARARDLDTLRFRADSAINRAIRDIGGRHPSLAFADLEAEFGAFDDADTFIDHVHFSEKGLYLASAAIIRSMAKWYEIQPPLAPDELADRMLRSPWSERRESVLMLSRRGRPPFTAQFGNAEQRDRLMRRIEQANARIATSDLGEWRAKTARYRELEPYDTDHAVLWGHILCTAHQWTEAAQCLQQVSTHLPGFTDAHGLAALALAMSGEPEKGAALLARTGPPYGYYLSQSAAQTADSMIAEGRSDLAERFVRSVLEAVPRFPDRRMLEKRFLDGTPAPHSIGDREKPTPFPIRAGSG